MYRPEILDIKDWEKAKNIIDYDIWLNIKRYIISLKHVNESAERFLSVFLQKLLNNDLHITTIAKMLQPQVFLLNEWNDIQASLDVEAWEEIQIYNLKMETLDEYLTTMLSLIFPDYFEKRK